MTWLQSLGWVTLVSIVVASTLGLWIRLSNLTSTGYNFDTITTQYTWAKALYEQGLLDFWLNYNKYYDYTYFNTIYLTAVYAIGQLFGGGESVFIGIIKTIYLLCDVVIIWLCWLIQTRFGVQRVYKLLTAGFLWLYPGFWFVSGVWGQSDGLHATIIVASLALLLSTRARSWWWSGIVFGIAFWFKLQALLPLLILLLFVITPRYQLWWKDLKPQLKFLLPSTLYAVFSLAYFAVFFTMNKGVDDGTTLFASVYTPLWHLAALGIVQWLVVMCVLIQNKVQSSALLRKEYSFLFGFFSLTTMLTTIFIVLNPLQWYRTSLFPMFADPGVFRGVTNIKDWFIKLSEVFGYTMYQPYGRALLGVVFIALIIVFVRSLIPRIKQWNLAQYLLYAGIFIVLFFVFSTSRVQTRYASIGLTFLLIVLPLLKLRLYTWLAFAGIFLVYALNNIINYGATPIPGWLLWVQYPMWWNNYHLMTAVMVVCAGIVVKETIKGTLSFDKQASQSKTKS